MFVIKCHKFIQYLRLPFLNDVWHNYENIPQSIRPITDFVLDISQDRIASYIAIMTVYQCDCSGYTYRTSRNSIC